MMESSGNGTVSVQADVPLGPLCTMRVGGRARFLVEAHDERTLLAALAWAERQGLPVRILGGGSNLVVADAGVDAVVVRVGLRGVDVRAVEDAVEVTAAAGEEWDELVRLTVERGWAGLECLSGIPGRVGATPIQNVGAYGQEVADTVTAVRAVDRVEGRMVTLDHASCRFRYRDSVFKSDAAARYVVVGVTYRLRPGEAAVIRYPDLWHHLAARGLVTPTLRDVRAAVLAVRRTKSMVLDPDDPNRRSCGSFFVNPVLSAEDADRIALRARDPAMPRWPDLEGRVKVSAAWLIEQAGFRRGYRTGPVGLSSRHALAVVTHEGARAADVVSFARRLQSVVEARFGVRLQPEPVFWGFSSLEGGLPADG